MLQRNLQNMRVMLVDIYSKIKIILIKLCLVLDTPLVGVEIAIAEHYRMMQVRIAWDKRGALVKMQQNSAFMYRTESR